MLATINPLDHWLDIGTKLQTIRRGRKRFNSCINTKWMTFCSFKASVCFKSKGNGLSGNNIAVETLASGSQLMVMLVESDWEMEDNPSTNRPQLKPVIEFRGVLRFVQLSNRR